MSLEILRGVRERYELHTASALAMTPRGGGAFGRSLHQHRCLPDKAIDLIDEAAADLKMEATSKPAVVEAAESELRRIERSLLAAEQAPMEERVQHQQRRSEALDKLEQLQDRWQHERQQLQDLRQLQQRRRSCATALPKPSG